MVTQNFRAVNWKGIACYVGYNCADARRTTTSTPSARTPALPRLQANNHRSTSTSPTAMRSLAAL
jgi:hypothetical protein